MLANPTLYFATIEDPRRETNNKKHKLEDIIMLTLCAVLSGCEDWVAIEDFGLVHERWLKKFLELRHGIPSHDTLSKVMGKIKKEAFEEAFTNWMRDGLPGLGKQIAIDGKSLRGSWDRKGVVHMISAYATEAKLVLSACTVGEKENEITEIPNLLNQLDLRGAVVTIDAIGCQKEIAKQIINSGGDYVFGLKKNHPTLYTDVELWFEKNVDTLDEKYRYENLEKGHGRIETRRVSVSPDLAWLARKEEWLGLQTVAMIESTREIDGKKSIERRYYLASVSDVTNIAQTIRNHWAIENQQHWILDVQFGEDAHRARKDNSAANLAVIRRTALNLLRQDPSDKRSIRRRKWHALANEYYREKLLFGDTIDNLSQ